MAARIFEILRELAEDERGAALVEYSVILGILLVAALVSIGGVGIWVNGQWSTALGLLPYAFTELDRHLSDRHLSPRKDPERILAQPAVPARFGDLRRRD